MIMQRRRRRRRQLSNLPMAWTTECTNLSPKSTRLFFSSMLFYVERKHTVFQIFEVSKHCELYTIKKTYKLLSGAVKKRGHNYNNSSL
jgi:hypothetical protein